MLKTFISNSTLLWHNGYKTTLRSLFMVVFTVSVFVCLLLRSFVFKVVLSFRPWIAYEGPSLQTC